MASPIAAGEAALLRAAFPGLTNTKVISHIVRTSDRLQSPIQARINVGAALTTQPGQDPESTPAPVPTAIPVPTPTPSPTPTPVPVATGNGIDDAKFFVTQHYQDFLSRGRTPPGSRTGQIRSRSAALMPLA